MAGAKPSATTISDHPSSFLSQNPNFFQLTTDVFIMERGPRYKAYADLRESKLRLKSMANPPPLPPKDHRSANNSTPPDFQPKLPAHRRKGSSVLTQSVPDFSSALRKENRRPALPPVAEKSATPPAKSSSRLYEINARLMGSKSSVSGEKKGGGMLTARKSYANMDELKKFSLAAANAINGENGGGRITRNRGGGGRTTVLGCRQYY
ncbi:uncharacterized protein LOC112520340 [Cynara cardunculus var. scolymus]|uniref:Uncharacterized protein n=1 Tax=Cynara cardunculus var. scolymus TaxID=59895 RepID=A0A103Y094_CYNCS|nr:uncharacterized protein LOC112520340 [Cynara cardunculus var. scolymus]KVI00139.1 hypothetical protein Ccrd_021636 [Cynara cardunculus var. scolymus]